jgi:L-methionine (R)-S-oxide reductase
MMRQYDSVDYELLNEQLAALMSAEIDALANSANFVGLLYNAISGINWLGIYVLRGDELVLGPFQGKPACVRIPLGTGVCGNAAQKQQTLRIKDVHEFDGHIACDSASRSEIVVPLISSGTLLGVLDVDSPDVGRFSEMDQSGIETLCTTFVEQLEQREVGQPEFI